MAAMGTSVSPDTAPPDFGTDIGMIRALIPDVEQVDYRDQGTPEYMFSDQHLMGLYRIAPGEGSSRLYRAAASALRALAVSEGLIQKVIRTEDLQTDGAKLASALLAGARALEERGDAAEDDDMAGMIIVDFQPQPQDRLSFTMHGFPEPASGGFGGSCARWL